MDITLPAIPAGILTLLSLLAPYVIAIINRPTWSAATKRVVSVAASVILAALVIIGYFWITGDAPPDYQYLFLLAIVVVQASYALVAKGLGAAQLEARTFAKAISEDGAVPIGTRNAVGAVIARRESAGPSHQ